MYGTGLHRPLRPQEKASAKERLLIELNELVYYARWRNSQNSEPDSNAATGSVKTHAAAMLRRVDIWSPLRLAAMVPATPELRTWVVLTGRPKLSAAEMVAMATNSAQAPWA